MPKKPEPAAPPVTSLNDLCTQLDLFRISVQENARDLVRVHSRPLFAAVREQFRIAIPPAPAESWRSNRGGQDGRKGYCLAVAMLAMVDIPERGDMSGAVAPLQEAVAGLRGILASKAEPEPRMSKADAIKEWRRQRKAAGKPPTSKLPPWLNDWDATQDMLGERTGEQRLPLGPQVEKVLSKAVWLDAAEGSTFRVENMERFVFRFPTTNPEFIDWDKPPARMLLHKWRGFELNGSSDHATETEVARQVREAYTLRPLHLDWLAHQISPVLAALEWHASDPADRPGMARQVQHFFLLAHRLSDGQSPPIPEASAFTALKAIAALTQLKDWCLRCRRELAEGKDRTPQSQDKWPTQSATAKLIGISRGRISHMVKDGTLRSNGKSGRDCRVDPGSIVEYQERQRKRDDDWADGRI